MKNATVLAAGLAAAACGGAPPLSSQSLDGTANLQEEFREIVLKCWLSQSDPAGDEVPLVGIRLDLNPDGSLESPPKILGRPEYSSNPGWRIAAEISHDAINRCAPFGYFSVEHYEEWKSLTLGYRLSASPRRVADGITIEMHSELIVDSKTKQALDQDLQKVSACWSSSMRDFVGEPNVTTIKFSLDRSGALTGEPRLLGDQGAKNALLRDFLAGSPIETVKACAPFDQLPADRYAEWKDAVLHLQVNSRTID